MADDAPWALPRARGRERDSVGDSDASESAALLKKADNRRGTAPKGDLSRGGRSESTTVASGGGGDDDDDGYVYPVESSSSSSTVSDKEWRTVTAVAMCLFCIHCQPSEAFLTE